MAETVYAVEAAPAAALLGTRLTPREREVLAILARGLSYREIGGLLGISHATVRAHLHSAYRKLRVGSRARAVIKMNEIQSRPAPEIVLA